MAPEAGLEGLVAEAERLGLLELVSRIFPENHASLALHRRVAFEKLASTSDTASSAVNGAIA